MLFLMGVLMLTWTPSFAIPRLHRDLSDIIGLYQRNITYSRATTTFLYELTQEETRASLRLRRAALPTDSSHMTEIAHAAQYEYAQIESNITTRSIRKRGLTALGTCIAHNHYDAELDAFVVYHFHSALCDAPAQNDDRSFRVWCIKEVVGLVTLPQVDNFPGNCPPRTYCIDDYDPFEPGKRTEVDCSSVPEANDGDVHSVAVAPDVLKISSFCTAAKHVPFPTSRGSPHQGSQGRGNRARRYRAFEEAVNVHGKAVKVAKLWINDLSSRWQFPRAEKVNARSTYLDITINKGGPRTHEVEFCAELAKGSESWVTLHYGSYDVTTPPL